MDPRRRVAKEAARLLYTGAVEEYKQAKEAAARSLSVEALPSNYEVAMELDLLVEEVEGEERKKLIIRMREAALKVMRPLADYDPRLIGSVWRGTARRGSDIDITVYAYWPEEVAGRLEAARFSVEGIEEITILKQGRPISSHHINVRLREGYEADVTVRSPEKKGEAERCEIYGDLKRGLTLPELEKLMRSDPLRKFVPRRRGR